MTSFSIATIPFTPSQPAQALLLTAPTPAAVIIDQLKISPPRALLILNGGTAQLAGDRQQRLAQLLQAGLARVVAEAGITVITGGTDAGIFALFGQGRAQWPGHAPCIGVAVAGLASWPGQPGAAPLEAHHSHFVLVNGESWGAETPTMYQLAAALSQNCPAVALFAGGGEITIRELQQNVAQKRPMILLAGSGRATDDVLAARAGESVADPRLTEIARFPGIIPFAVEKAPHLLRRLLQRLLFGTETTQGTV